MWWIGLAAFGIGVVLILVGVVIGVVIGEAW